MPKNYICPGRRIDTLNGSYKLVPGSPEEEMIPLIKDIRNPTDILNEIVQFFPTGKKKAP